MENSKFEAAFKAAPIHSRNGENDMDSVTPEQVWEAIMANQEFAAQPEELREVAKPYVMAMPEVLKEQMGESVTLASLLTAKLAFFRYVVENGMIAKMAENYPPLAAASSPENVQKLFEKLLVKLEELVQKILADVDGYLAGLGLSEEQAMLNPDFGLNKEAVALYQKGELTIAYLVANQPMVIYKNTK